MSAQIITIVRAELPGGERAVAWRENSNWVVVLDSRLTAAEQKAALKTAVRRQRRRGLAAFIPAGGLIWWLRMKPSHRNAAVAGSAVGLAAIATAATLPFIGGEQHRPPPTAAPPRPRTSSAPEHAASTPSIPPTPSPPRAAPSPSSSAGAMPLPTPSTGSPSPSPPASARPTPPIAGSVRSLCILDLDRPLRLPVTARVCLQGNKPLT